MSDTEDVVREDVRPNENSFNTVSHSDAVMNEYRTLVQKMQAHFSKSISIRINQYIMFPET